MKLCAVFAFVCTVRCPPGGPPRAILRSVFLFEKINNGMNKTVIMLKNSYCKSNSTSSLCGGFSVSKNLANSTMVPLQQSSSLLLLLLLAAAAALVSAGRPTTFYDLSAKEMNNDVLVEFSEFRGRVVLITNVASECGE